MPEGLIAAAARRPEPEDMRIEGVAIAQVVNNIDLMGLARVQLSLPWFPGIEPWARVAVPSAGRERGMYLIPQVGDEVLVVFNHGDIRDPYVLASLGNSEVQPPTGVPTAPVPRRMFGT